MEFLVFIVILILYSLLRSLAGSGDRREAPSPHPSPFPEDFSFPDELPPKREHKEPFRTPPKGQEKIKSPDVQPRKVSEVKTLPEEEEERSASPLPAPNRNNLITGLLMAEVLEPPRSRRPRRHYFKAGQ